MHCGVPTVESSGAVDASAGWMAGGALGDVASWSLINLVQLGETSHHLTILAYECFRAADLTRDGRVYPEAAAWRRLSDRDRERRLMRDGDLILERSGGGPENARRACCDNRWVRPRVLQ